MTVLSKALPFGGPTGTTPDFRGTVKVVDRSNPNAKFAKRNASIGGASTIFDFDTPQNESQPRAPIARHADPLQGGEPCVSKPCGVRITKMDEAIKEREDFRYHNPRFLRRSCNQTVHEQDENARFTAYGQRYGGKAVVIHTNTESQAPKARNEHNMERFRLTPRPNSNVLLPQTLEDSTPKPKFQRFQQSKRNTDSLVGVLGRTPQQLDAAVYKVQAPWSTTE